MSLATKIGGNALLSLNGQVAIITGCGGGIGRAIALKLASLGAHIVVNDVNQGAAERVADEVAAMGVEALVSTASVADAAGVEQMAKAALDKWQRIDILVNNAGITRDNLLLRMKDDEWDAVLDVNLRGTFLCTRAVCRAMVRARYGRIINIASVVGVRGNPGQANYAASKGGIIAFTKSVARELGSRGITCNAVAPGVVDTPMFRALAPETQEEWIRQIPVGRAGLPADVAEAVAFFASPATGYITGQVIHVNGGLYT
jgi:3-oxoacyl-[acyl-carrier protein] reductase